jgi:hypothetical protein
VQITIASLPREVWLGQLAFKKTKLLWQLDYLCFLLCSTTGYVLASIYLPGTALLN